MLARRVWLHRYHRRRLCTRRPGVSSFLLKRKSFDKVVPHLKDTKAAGCCLDNFATVHDTLSVSDETVDALFTACQCICAGPDSKPWLCDVRALVLCKGMSVEECVRDAKGALCAPKRVEFVAELPLTPLGKPDKKALRARYWANAERAVN